MQSLAQSPSTGNLKEIDQDNSLNEPINALQVDPVPVYDADIEPNDTSHSPRLKRKRSNLYLSTIMDSPPKKARNSRGYNILIKERDKVEKNYETYCAKYEKLRVDGILPVTATNMIILRMVNFYAQVRSLFYEDFHHFIDRRKYY